MNARLGWRGLLIAAVAGVMALGPLVGCSGWPTIGKRKGGLIARMTLAERERMVAIEGDPVTLGRFVALDVANKSGGVFVTTHERYNEAKIEARVRHRRELEKLARQEGWDEGVLRGPWFTAVNEHGPETGVLRIRPTDKTLPDGSRPLVDLYVYTPACDGVQITSKHGNVELVGVRGSLDVEAEGRIEVRSNEPLTEEMNLRSAGEGVIVVAAPKSRGTFLITAPEGRATFTSKYGTPERVSSERSRWMGVWNAGPNPVTLHAEHGNARFMVRENAEMYTPSF